MAKFYGVIGFAQTKETSPGIWAEEIEEKECYGDLLSFTRRYQTNKLTSTNDDITINNKVSILADPYMLDNFQFMRYIIYPYKNENSPKWKIESVEIEYPRLILSIGGLYNA